MNFKNLILIVLSFVWLIACQQKVKNIQENQNVKVTEQAEKINSVIYGNYVDDSYDKRAEGYDWVAVSVKENGSNSIAVSIRSRADKKSPTCTFDTRAYKEKNSSYEALYDGKKIVFDFTNHNLTISAKNEENSGLLNFFCSGGATIAGSYKKIETDIDLEQIDPTSFSKILTLQGIDFNISAIEKKGENTLTVSTFGLEEPNYKESFGIVGEQVIDAEVEDLNADGSPELFVYTQSTGSGSYGKVYAFSVNNKKSMSPVYFQPTAENEKINQGYMGHDEFSVVENSLVQRFPIYNEGDINSNPTGGTRQVSYKLIDGEAMRKLEVDEVSKY